MTLPRMTASLSLGLALIATSARAADAPTSQPTSRIVHVDFSKQQPAFAGWGTSLCWWANGVGGWDEQTVDQIVHLVTDPDAGLGMNVFRYNIGGGDDPSHHHMRRWGDVPGFKPSADAAYDWSADANQRRVLLKLVAARPDAIVEAFSNSPPFWMTASGCTGGGRDGGPNLPPEREADFVRYLVDVAAHYHTAHHVTFHSVEPFNEPDAGWWTTGKDQEGCKVPRDQQARVITRLREELDKAGLNSTLVSATDANNIDDAVRSLGSFDPPTLTALGQINAHSYAGTQRGPLQAIAAQNNKPLWQSETGPLSVGGTSFEQMLKVADRITQDVNEMRPQVWCTWQVMAGGPWGCLNENAGRQTFRVGKMFHVLASFTQHVRPGDHFVDVTGDGHAVAAFSKTRSEATIVLVNQDKTSVNVHVTLDGLGKPPAQATVSRTSATEDLATVPALPVQDSALDIELPAESVTRLLLPADAN